MTTVAELIASTQNHVYGMHKEIINFVDTSILAADTSLVLSDTMTNQVSIGSLLSIEDELLYVRSVNTSARSVTVRRGFRNTTAAAHAAGTIVEINPRFPQVYLRQLLLEEIRSWSQDLFRVTYFDLNFTSSTLGYDLTGAASGVNDFYFPLELSIGPDSGSSDTTRYTGQGTGWQVVSSGGFASGRGLVLNRGYERSGRLSVAQAFNLATFTDATDVVGTAGLAQSMVDIPPYGAAWRALASREIKRSFTEGQGEMIKNEQVPPMYQMQVSAQLKKLRDTRLNEEKLKLRSRYPIRTVGA